MTRHDWLKLENESLIFYYIIKEKLKILCSRIGEPRK